MSTPQHDAHAEHRTDGSGVRHRWLCIAYAFPPMQRSGTHRTAGFVRELDRLGWDADVVTATSPSESLDDALLSMVPPGTDVVRVPWRDPVDTARRLLPRRSPRRVAGRSGSATVTALPDPAPRGSVDFITRMIQTPDSRASWIWPAVKAAWRVIQRRRPRILYTTSPYMSAHVAGLVLSHLTRVPWVADFRDPWRGNPFRHLPYLLQDWWDDRLERMVIRRADRIVCNTAPAEALGRFRHPDAAWKFRTIMNGFDASKLAGLVPKRAVPADLPTIAHCGQFYGRRRPEPVFRALRELADRHPDWGRDVRLLLVGDICCDGEPLMAIAKREGVADQVHCTGPVSQSAALSYAAGADIVLLVGADGAGADLQVPNKLFEYLSLGRPILAGASAGNPARHVLETAKAVHAIFSPDSPSQIADGIVRLRHAKVNPLTDFSGAVSFSREARARELAALFDEVSREPRRRCPLLRSRSVPRDALLYPPDDIFADSTSPAYG